MTQASNEALKRLAKALENLKIAQADVKDAYELLTPEQQTTVPSGIDTVSLDQLESSSEDESIAPDLSSTKGDKRILIEGTEFYIGEQVRIKNPRPHQEREGKVIGKTKGKDFFIRVETSRSIIVLRKSFNLEKVEVKKNDRKRKSTSYSNRNAPSAGNRK